MNAKKKKQYPDTKFTIRVYEEGVEILDMVVETNNRLSDVTIHDKRDNLCSAWEPVSTAMGAAAFWVWKLTFSDNIFPELLSKNEGPSED